MEELRLFALKRVADELQKPAKNEESGGKHPERMIENSTGGQRKRHHDQRNTNTMTEPVYWMSMAARILRDPLFAAAATKHGRIITQYSYCGVSRKTRVGPAWTWLSAETS
jgi:hypothetical protein